MSRPTDLVFGWLERPRAFVLRECMVVACKLSCLGKLPVLVVVSVDLLCGIGDCMTQDGKAERVETQLLPVCAVVKSRAKTVVVH